MGLIKQGLPDPVFKVKLQQTQISSSQPVRTDGLFLKL